MARFEDPAVHFREVQAPRQWWILAIVALVTAGAWYTFVEQILLGHRLGTDPAPDWAVWLLLGFFGVVFPLVLLTARMVVVVDDHALLIRWIPFGKRTIPLAGIVEYEACAYRPIREYLGWGIRWVPGRGTVWSVSGNRGVQLVLLDGRRVLVGSKRPEELAAAIRRAKAG